MTQLVVPHMAKNKKGLVINVGSIVGAFLRPPRSSMRRG